MTPHTLPYLSSARNDLCFDIFECSDAPRGVVIFVHGGALLLGGREDLPAGVVALIHGLGFHVASIDYRAVPNTTVEEILGDVMEGIESARHHFPGAPITLVGYSAGAYLSLMHGTRGMNLARIVAFAGYGDLCAKWYSEPSEFFCAYKNVEYMKAAAETRAAVESLEEKIDLYVYLRQKGLWPRYALGTDRLTEKMRAFSPVAHLSSTYPPTVLVHGDADSDVPVEASRDFAIELAKANVRHKLIVVPGFDHDLFEKVGDPIVSDVWTSALTGTV